MSDREKLAAGFRRWIADHGAAADAGIDPEYMAYELADVAIKALDQPPASRAGILDYACTTHKRVRLVRAADDRMPVMEVNCVVDSITYDDIHWLPNRATIRIVRISDIHYTNETMERIARQRGAGTTEVLRRHLPLAASLTGSDIEAMHTVEIADDQQPWSKQQSHTRSLVMSDFDAWTGD